MRPTYNNLLLEQLFFSLLNFLFLSFIFLPSLLFPTFSLFLMCSLFFLFLSFIFEKSILILLILYQRTRELWCRIVKIYSENVYDIFYHKWFVYISIVHTIHIFLYFFITLFKFYKNVCKEMCINHDLFFY